MSSHREAPEISKDPVADNTDVYAFVSPDVPSHVTIIANFIPFQVPYGGPNFSEFGNDVVYDINISNSGTAEPDVIFRFKFSTIIRNNSTFLYNIGPISSVNDKNWIRPQTFSLTRIYKGEKPTLIRTAAECPPCNVGPRSTPDYLKLVDESIHTYGTQSWMKVFAGQRAEGFHVDLGSIFDLGVLRPFAAAHLIPSAAAMDGVNGTQGLNVHSIAIQVPIQYLTKSRTVPTDVMSSDAVIGVWATSARQTSRVFDTKTSTYQGHGAYQQVSRLANPLFNEVITPMKYKDQWNASKPQDDKQYADYVLKPELAALLPVLYPGVFPNLAAYKKPRNDLAAILLTGIPAGIIDGFQNYTGPVQADMVRLNVAIPPAKNPSPLGILGGDLAGFPNGRRPIDDVVAIELKAVAGATIPLVDPSFTPDATAAKLNDGTTNTNSPYLDQFPYLGTPAGGYETKPGTPASSGKP